MAINPDTSFLFEPTASLPVLKDIYLEDDHPGYPALKLEAAEAETHERLCPDDTDEHPPPGPLNEQLDAAKIAFIDILSRAQENITATYSTVTAQQERIAELETELVERDELADALACEQKAGEDWESEALLAQTAREKLEDELLLRQTEIDKLRADRDALTHQLVELEARRQEQDVLFCEFQDQLRDKDDELANLEARLARLSLVETAEQHAGLTVETPMFGSLVRIDGPCDIDYAIGESVETIGREAGNTIQIRESHVSRHHARLERRGDDTYIEDLGSTNGIYVNGLRTTSKALADGDQISIGSTEFRYQATPPI